MEGPFGNQGEARRPATQGSSWRGQRFASVARSRRTATRFGEWLFRERWGAPKAGLPGSLPPATADLRRVGALVLGERRGGVPWKQGGGRMGFIQNACHPS